METPIVALIIIALLLFAMLTLGQGYLVTQDRIMQSWQAMEERAGERARTSLVPVAAEVLHEGDEVAITVRNDGAERLADYAQWDVILEYDAGGLFVGRWYPYTEAAGSGANQWTVAGIYLDASRADPEVVDPGILNPGEEMVIQVRISPPVDEGGTVEAAVSTPNGIAAQAALSR